MSQNKDIQFSAFVGIDWADQKHDICLSDPKTNKLEFLVLKHSPKEIDLWAMKLKKRFKDGLIAVCLEQTKGPLIYALLKYDFLILYPVNPQSLSNYRRTFATSRAKDDPSDAALQVDFLLKHRDKLSPWIPDEPQTRSLQRLVELRKSLVHDKIRLSNKITSHLKDYFPLALDLFPDKDTQVFCDFLLRWPTLKKAQKIRKTTFELFLKSHNSYRQGLFDERFSELKSALPLTEDDCIITPSALMVEALVGQFKLLRQSISKLDKAIQKLCKSHNDFFIFNSLPGAGDVFVPRLIAAFGSNRNRYRSANDLLKYSGVAPVLERSGKKSWVHWRYACPKFLRQTFVEWAGQTIHYSFWAKIYYQKKRDQGHNHSAATRALAFKWIRILFRCWQDHKPYDEAIYLLALQRNHSPILAGLEKVSA